MKVITAPQKIDSIDKPTVFLAGGITNCPEWQDELILQLKDVESAVLLNPRRKNFPIDDPNAAQEQIAWEFQALEQANIFSMWFSDSDSDQPICMYELGRNVALRKNNINSIVIGVEEGYSRSQDVEIQMSLINKKISSRISNNLNQHAFNILGAISAYQNRK